MREIKFRYYYSDGEYWFDRDFNLTEIENGYPYEVLSDSPLLKKYKLRTRVQFTGLLDKNGKEIYEGDIVKNTCKRKIFTDEGTGRYGYVDKTRSSIAFVSYDSHWCKFNLTSLSENEYGIFEVIGNIYENSKLLI